MPQVRAPSRLSVLFHPSMISVSPGMLRMCTAAVIRQLHIPNQRKGYRHLPIRFPSYCYLSTVTVHNFPRRIYPSFS